MGAIATWVDSLLGTHIWKIVGILFASTFIIIAYAYSAFRENKLGVTTEYAALFTYFLGIIIMSGYATAAVILSILVLVLLASKKYLQQMKERFSRVELADALKFGVIALVVLPLLPDQKFSLLDMINWFANGSISLSQPILMMKFFNPYSVWFFVVIMAGVEYVGYILSKVMGNRGGIVASGAVGGLISSTATTAALTNKSNTHPANRYSYASATLIASCIMFIRVILISTFYNPLLLATIFLPASVMFLTLSGSAYYFFYKAKKERLVKIDEKEHPYESPFRIIPALQFAGIVVAIKFLAGIGAIYSNLIPENIFYPILGLLSGLADVDAITQTMASESVLGKPTLMVAASTILIAVMSNNFVKASIAKRFGESVFGNAVMKGFGISIVSGLLVI